MSAIEWMRTARRSSEEGAQPLARIPCIAIAARWSRSGGAATWRTTISCCSMRSRRARPRLSPSACPTSWAVPCSTSRQTARRIDSSSKVSSTGRLLPAEIDGPDAERLRERLERVERGRPLAALQHGDVRDGDPRLLGEGLLAELLREATGLQVGGDGVDE